MGGMSDTSPLYFGVLIYTDEVLIKSFSSTIATQQSNTGNTRHLKGQSKKTILPAGSVAKVKSHTNGMQNFCSMVSPSLSCDEK